jgi:hypothetical protein
MIEGHDRKWSIRWPVTGGQWCKRPIIERWFRQIQCRRQAMKAMIAMEVDVRANSGACRRLGGCFEDEAQKSTTKTFAVSESSHQTRSDQGWFAAFNFFCSNRWGLGQIFHSSSIGIPFRPLALFSGFVMAPQPSGRIRRYQDVLTTTLHRRFLKAAFVSLVVCYLEAFIIGAKSSCGYCISLSMFVVSRD